MNTTFHRLVSQLRGVTAIFAVALTAGCVYYVDRPVEDGYHERGTYSGYSRSRSYGRAYIRAGRGYYDPHYGYYSRYYGGYLPYPHYGHPYGGGGVGGGAEPRPDRPRPPAGPSVDAGQTPVTPRQVHEPRRLPEPDVSVERRQRRLDDRRDADDDPPGP